MTRDVGEISVVVPAHDEEERIGRCLSSLRVAARHPAVRGRRVKITVVLDACSDRTADEVAGFADADEGVDGLEVAHRSVGSARAAGFDERLRRSEIDPSHHWLATTDADSAVPPDWLARQLAWHARGADVVAGTVRVRDWSEQPQRVGHHFDHRQHGLGLGLGHPHVHGANLGLTAVTYRAAGGVPDLRVAEDHALWDAAGAVGARRVSAPDLTVTTSGRREGRAAGGFSDLLRSL